MSGRSSYLTFIQTNLELGSFSIIFSDQVIKPCIIIDVQYHLFSRLSLLHKLIRWCIVDVLVFVVCVGRNGLAANLQCSLSQMMKQFVDGFKSGESI